MLDEPKRDAARDALLALLARHVDAGRPVPCVSVPAADRGYWTSDHPDEQQLAASMCQHCPALTECAEYGATYPREAGTYGGLTEHDRRASVARHRKAAS